MFKSVSRSLRMSDHLLKGSKAGGATRLLNVNVLFQIIYIYD